MLKHKFSLRETVLVIVAAVLALSIFYYQVIYKNYQDALKQYDTSNVTEQLTVLTAKAAKMKNMETYVKEHQGKTVGEVAVYNNLSNEIEALGNVTANRAKSVSISWSEPTLTDNIVRRNADITVVTGSYGEAESLINDIADLKYRCVISSLSITGANSSSVDSADSVTTVMSVTFFETTDGAANTNGLVVSADSSESN